MNVNSDYRYQKRGCGWTGQSTRGAVQEALYVLCTAIRKKLASCRTINHRGTGPHQTRAGHAAINKYRGPENGGAEKTEGEETKRGKGYKRGGGPRTVVREVMVVRKGECYNNYKGSMGRAYACVRDVDGSACTMDTVKVNQRRRGKWKETETTTRNRNQRGRGRGRGKVMTCR